MDGEPVRTKPVLHAMNPSVRMTVLAAFAALGFGLPAGAAELVIQEGVVVKFGSDADLVVRDKVAIGKGTAFTSVKDDQLGGQVGATAQAPAVNDWRGISIEKSAVVNGPLTINDTIVRYGGDDNRAALTIRGFGTTVTLQNLQITDNAVGLRLDATTSPSISTSSFARNGIGIEANESSKPTVSSSQFVSNATKGLLNNTPAQVITASGNWWGHSTGPADPSGNPSGQGDAVSTGVSYGGFATSAPLINPTVRLAAPQSYFEDRTVTLSLSCVNAVEYRVAEGDAFAGISFQPLSDGRATLPFTVSATDGNKVIKAQYRNAAGLIQTAILSGGATVDTQAPAVTITNPAPGSIIGGPITFSASASDGYGVASVKFYVNGTLKSTDSTAPYSYSWNNDSDAEGNHDLKVVATDLAGRTTERTHSIQLARTPPPPDTTGPTMASTSLRLGGSVLNDGATVTGNGTLAVDATDPSSVSRIEFELDDVIFATKSSPSSGTTYSATLNIDNIGNGAHVLVVRAFDSLNNSANQTRNLTVAHAAPNAPTISKPAAGLVTRNTATTVTGTAQANRQIQLHINDTAVGSPVTATSNGAFSIAATLTEGPNYLKATATDQWGTSTFSSIVTVTVDSSVPLPPTNLAASGQAAGKIRVTWTKASDPKVTGYHVYRASAAFATLGEAVKVASVAATSSSVDDLAPVDGTYYYRIVSVNAASTTSDLSNQAQAVSDNTLPRATLITYSPQGQTDPETGRVGQGRVDVTVTVNEPLIGAPYLSIVPAGSAPIPLDLTRQDDLHYAGFFLIGESTGTGLANAIFSARDLVGNRGTNINSGQTLNIDAKGPTVTGIALTPPAPIKADGQPGLVTVFTFDEALKSGVSPQLTYLLSGTGRTSAPINATLSGTNEWTATFTLPIDAGQAAPETLSFAYQGQDTLDNVSTQVSATNRFEVYQGNLPPGDVPINFKALARPAGQVLLTWNAASNADEYQVFRKAPGESELTPLNRTAAVEHTDATTVDGEYTYAVASVRHANSQESLSSQSLPVQIVASGTPPAAPTALTLELTGQGVKALWQAPVGGSAAASYNLYRSSSATITSTQGLTPLKTGIKQLGAIDAAPSPSQHAYAVTALDSAGNESPVSNSQYLNFSLLPVATLRVEQFGNNLPVVRWTAGGSGAAGYDVHVGEGAAAIKLNSSLVTGTSFTDSGYTSGERYYTVTAVDSNDARQPRSILLPNLATQIASGLPVKRGVMNLLQVQVTNLSSSAISGAKALVKLGSYEHRSAAFSLGANETRLVPVVVGGYSDLPNPVAQTAGLEITPAEGEFVVSTRIGTADVIDSSLVVGMATEEFTRGGTGKVRLTIENTSDVEVELLTARSSGTADSDELRFKIMDLDGNVLTTQPFRQALGSSVITLATGQTVARIPAGASYTSNLFEMDVPLSSPEKIRVKLEVDKVRYHTGQSDQVLITGRSAERTVALIDTAYYGEVTAVTPVTSFGDEDIVIAGRAADRNTGAALANVPLQLLLNQEGFERKYDLLSDAAGTFSYTFKPGLGDAGLFRVAAVHPDITDRPEQRSFTINRVTVGPTTYKLDVPRNYTFSIPFSAKAGAGTQASNVRLVLDPTRQPTGQVPAGVTVQLPTPVTITARQTLNLPVAFTANNTAASSGSLVFDAFSDEHSASPLGQVRVNYTLTVARPHLTSTPSFVETGLALGGSALESFVVANSGLEDALDLAFTLTKVDGTPAPSWVAIASAADGTLAVGAKRNVDISFTPSSAVTQGVYQFKLHVQGTNVPTQSLNVFASVTESGVGNVLFKAADIYTGTFVPNTQTLIEGLKGATIIVQNEDVATVTAQKTTDVKGDAFFQGLPAGRYKFRAKAANHQEIGGRFQIKPGITLTQPAFLEYNLVTVEWSVREITIEDRYEITLDAIFETNVPAAVVALRPTSINLPPMKPGDIYYGELTLSNQGLVRADNVHFEAPAADEFFRYEFLVEVPYELAAGQRITIPYRVISLKALDGDGAASGGGCYSYSKSAKLGCSYVCANGTKSSNCGSSTYWFSSSNSSCPAGQSAPNQSGGATYGSGSPPVQPGGFGGSGGTTGDSMPIPGVPSCVKCGSGCCQGGGGDGQGGFGQALDQFDQVLDQLNQTLSGPLLK